MMKTLAIVGASYLQLPLVKKANELGLHTICFAWAEGAVCKDEADEFYPISVLEKDAILSICEGEKIDGICTIASDIAAPTVAYVAERMGLIGNPYEVALRASNKYLMRRVFWGAGIPCPLFWKVSRCEQIDCTDLRFPLIVKPTDRSGSLGVVKVERKESLHEAVENALSFSFAHEAIIEEYIEGREISVEFISYQGVHFPLQITDKVTTGAPHFVELEHHQPAELTNEQYTLIYDLTKRALTALGIKNGASHSEYRITKDGDIYIMEIGARMGGDFIGSDLVRLSTGYDYVRGVIDVALAEFTPPLLHCSQHAGVFFLCEETKHLLKSIEQPDSSFVVRAEITDPALHSVSCSADRSGYLIYYGNKRLVL